MLILPWSVWDCWWLAPLALAVDLVFGDPPLPWPHPIRVVGSLISSLEKPARKFMGDDETRGRAAGFVAVALVCLVVGSAVWLLLSLPWLGPLFALYLAWAGLAMGCLLDAGAETSLAIETAPLPEARAALSMLVSRETGSMDRAVLRKTLADTLSENFTDAFVAPFFWLLVAGPIGLWVYKSVSCFDSQWGYLTPRWKALGFAGARGDDFLAWLPARLGCAGLWLCDFIARLLPIRRSWRGLWPGWKIIAADAKGMPSPNSGWSMAACAWLCYGRMAGSSVYFGELIEKPWLGPVSPLAVWDRKKLLSLPRLLKFASIITGSLLCLFCYALEGSFILCRAFI